MSKLKEVKMVVGANFGDEGKGLMTDYFVDCGRKQGKKCLVICHNGGPQKGHTVTTPKGIRHVFHHFGAGGFSYADTYLAEQFIVNPMIFRKEWEELHRLGATTICYIDKKCKLALPYDLLLNQLLEQSRGAKRHGSCGMGIYETILRNKMPDYAMTVEGFMQLGREEQENFLKKVREEYVKIRRVSNELSIADEQLEAIISSDFLIENYLEDWLFFLRKVTVTSSVIWKEYDTLIFEGSQGLLLDQNNLEYMPHLTPSNTGIHNPMELVQKQFKEEELEIECCYVTRTYLTRHGAGRFDTECDKEKINPDMIDQTNISNPFQEHLRYGLLDLEELRKRIEQDCRKANWPVNLSIAITHLNETENQLVTTEGREEVREIGNYRLYVSNGETRNSITIEQN